MLGHPGWFQKRRLNKALLKAAAQGATEEVRRLLDAGASANAEDRRETALSFAGRSHLGNAATVQLLLERGALVNGDPKRGTVNPLVRASHQSDAVIIRPLVTRGANVNAVQPGLSPGLMPLQELVKWAELETLALLLEHGADINQMSWGGAALHSATAVGRPDVVAFLLSNGADPALLDARGQTAVDSARTQLAQPYYHHKERQRDVSRFLKTIALLKKEPAHAQVADDQPRRGPLVDMLEGF